MDNECQSKYCLRYGKGLWFCNCQVADKNGSAAYVGLCPANRRLRKDNEDKDKELKKLLGDM